MTQPAIEWLSALLSLGFGLLFFAAGISKFLRANSIRRTVENYQLLPAFATPIFACMLAPAETLAGLLFILSPLWPTYLLAWGMAMTLLTLFSVAIASALFRGLEIPCGCGVLLSGHVITRATLLRNFAFLGLLIADLGWRESLLGGS